MLAVCLTGQASIYNYAVAEAELANLKATTDAGCQQVLAQNEYADLDDASRKLSASIPKIISVDFNPAASTNVLNGTLLDIVAAMRQATSTRRESIPSMEAWLKTRPAAPASGLAA